ncbi:MULTISPECIES: NUDIX domain-containing protein [unclassified Streptomyces]|uniref:NUDIX domain-containing protein n=1 Tax=unclassified Streptomyces TaxID=2593676 RepID=UPI002E19FBB3|nr:MULTISPECIES: NUDIX domain-containing protein [unclassified Streptomyces]
MAGLDPGGQRHGVHARHDVQPFQIACDERRCSEVELRLDVRSLIAGAVVARSGSVLLVRRAVPEGALVWQFPAGKVDSGEAPFDAAAREALEEAGVVVEPLALIGERLHPVTGRRVAYVACLWRSGQARPASPREVAEVAWVPFGQLTEWIPGGVYGPVWEYLTGPALP